MNHNIRARIVQQAANGVGLHQVVVGAAGHEDVLRAVLAHDAYAAAVPKARVVVVVSGLVLHEDENLCHELHELGRSDSATNGTKMKTFATNYTNWDELFFSS
jgi:phosphoketolase